MAAESAEGSLSSLISYSSDNRKLGRRDFRPTGSQKSLSLIIKADNRTRSYKIILA